MTRHRSILMPTLLALAAVVAGCRQLPDNTVKPRGGDAEEYARLVMEARDAFERMPRTEAAVVDSAEKFARALKITADDYATLWQAARTSAWMGEYGAENLRERHVRDGLAYTNTAIKLRADSHEARFYHGVLAGFLGELDHSYGLDAARNIELDMKALIDADARLANAGPWRVYGVLLLRAPGPPTSVGSLRNARKMLQKALELAPDWPENHLYAAEMEFAWAAEKDQPAEAAAARERLQKYLLGSEARAPGGAEFEFARWQKQARELLKKHE